MQQPCSCDSRVTFSRRGLMQALPWLLVAALAQAQQSQPQTQTQAQLQPQAPETWNAVGQQGLVGFVIVPEAQARDRAAYARQVALLCEPERTCFLNFYTNSTGAVVALPLPDAIDREATAIYRRSAKQGAERFQWSCRLQVSQEPCF